MGEVVWVLSGLCSGSGGALAGPGRVSEVHKPLVAASKTADMGYDAFVDQAGGILMPRHGPLAVGVRREMHRLLKIHGPKGTIPMWREKGVYNFYLEMEKNKLSGATMDQPETLAPLEKPWDFPRQAKLP